jgi:hypothetical protein
MIGTVVCLCASRAGLSSRPVSSARKKRFRSAAVEIISPAAHPEFWLKTVTSRRPPSVQTTYAAMCGPRRDGFVPGKEVCSRPSGRRIRRLISCAYGRPVTFSISNPRMM